VNGLGGKVRAGLPVLISLSTIRGHSGVNGPGGMFRARASGAHRSEYDTVLVEPDVDAVCMRFEIWNSSDGWIWE